MLPDKAPIDELAALVLERKATGSDTGEVGIEVRLAQALPNHLQAALRAEAGRRKWVEGALVPTGLKARQEGRIIRVLLEPFDQQALRLDFLTEALGALGSALSQPLSALVVAAVAARIKDLHEKEVGDGYLSPRRILVGPGGGIAVVAPGLPLIATLLQPQEPKADRWRRRAPETLLHHRATPASDIYTLGALYYEFMTGKAYRADASPEALLMAAEAKLGPELPGLLADPRPSLVQLLTHLLAAIPSHRPSGARALQRAIRSELASSELGLASRHALAEFVGEYVDPKAPRGLETLFRDVEVRPSVRPASAPTTPSGSGATAARETSGSAWASVLGQDVEMRGSDRTEPQAALEPAPPETPMIPRVRPAPAASASAEPPVSEAKKLRLPSPSSSDKTESQPATGTDVPPVSSLSSRESAAPEIAAIQDASQVRAKPPTLDEATKLSTTTKLRLLASFVAVAAVIVAIGTLRSRMQAGRPAAVGPAASLSPPAKVSPAKPDKPQKRASPVATNTRRPGFRPTRRPQAAAEPASPKPGLISIMSTPTGADVAIDGSHVGTTPLVRSLPLDKPRYRLRVTMKNHRVWEQTVAVESGRLSRNVTLMPK